MSDDIVFVDALSACPTRKTQKIVLRCRFALSTANSRHTAGRRFSAVEGVVLMCAGNHAPRSARDVKRDFQGAVTPLACGPWISPFCRERLSLKSGERPGLDGHELPWPKAALRIRSIPSRDRTSFRTCGAHAAGGVRARRPCGCHPNAR